MNRNHADSLLQYPNNKKKKKRKENQIKCQVGIKRGRVKITWRMAVQRDWYETYCTQAVQARNSRIITCYDAGTVFFVSFHPIASYFQLIVLLLTFKNIKFISQSNSRLAYWLVSPPATIMDRVQGPTDANLFHS